jgi:uncharacterized membrane protein (UPF0127 family)
MHGRIFYPLALWGVLAGLFVACNSTTDVFELRLGQAIFKVEVATTPTELATGLMYRRQLAPDAGMLFVFSQPDFRQFWMKNTYLPLSIAFLDERGKVVDIQDMNPLDETIVESRRPAQYALEVNQGAFERYGVNIGDRMNVYELNEFLKRRAQQRADAR